jgi:hypothetical protein
MYLLSDLTMIVFSFWSRVEIPVSGPPPQITTARKGRIETITTRITNRNPARLLSRMLSSRKVNLDVPVRNVSKT